MVSRIRHLLLLGVSVMLAPTLAALPRAAYADDVPTLTIDDVQPTVTHPVDLTGHLLDGTTPLADVTVTVADDNGIIGTASTDATGAWTLTHTFTEARGYRLTATTPPDSARAAGYAERWIGVDRLLASIEATVPSTIPIGGTADITGTLYIDQQPAASKPVNWQAVCQDGEPIVNHYGQVTTAADGTFDIVFDPERCASIEFLLLSPGTPTVWYYDSPPYDITVPWHRYQVTADGPASVYVGQSYDVTFTTTRDGQPAPDLPLDVRVTAPPNSLQDLSGTTDSEGKLTVHVSAPEHDIYAVQATTPETADTLRDSGWLNTEAQPVPQTATLTATPSTVDAGGHVTLSGALSRQDGHVGGVDLTLTAHDGSGTTRSITTTTADDGSFTVDDVPPPGETTYTFMPDASQHYSDLAASTQVTVHLIQPQVRVTVRHPWRTIDGLPAYRTGTSTPMVALVTPRADAMCARFIVERHTAQAWRQVGFSGCRPTSDGRASWSFGGRAARPGLYRVQAVSGADTTHATARSARIRFRFVRR